MTDSTRQKALNALDGMKQIVEREMLVRGRYVTDEVIKPDLQDQLCQGRKYCAVGSLWVGAGVRPEIKLRGNGTLHVRLPGTMEGCERRAFLQHRPALRLAYDALNTAAENYVKRNRVEFEDDEDRDGPFDAPLEQLFEAGPDIGRTELLKIIAAAKRRVKAATA